MPDIDVPALAVLADHELLSPEEERLLAEQMRDARFYREMLRINPDLPAQTRASFERLVRRGVRARERLILCNQRLVIAVARRFHGTLPFEDLVSEGQEGLIAAADRFDPTRGIRFSTYAVWWIRQAIGRAVANQSRMVRLPVHVNDKVLLLRRTADSLEQQLGREPTAEELAAASGLPERSVRLYLDMARETLSLNRVVGDGGDDAAEFGEFLPDRTAPDPEREAMRQAAGAAIEEILETLTPREQQIIILRYGLRDGRPQTLEEIGRKLGVTRERIRQIEHQVLKKLRHPSRSRRLREFL